MVAVTISVFAIGMSILSMIYVRWHKISTRCTKSRSVDSHPSLCARLIRQSARFQPCVCVCVCIIRPRGNASHKRKEAPTISHVRPQLMHKIRLCPYYYHHHCLLSRGGGMLQLSVAFKMQSAQICACALLLIAIELISQCFMYFI